MPKPSADYLGWGIPIWFIGSTVAMWGLANPRIGVFGSVSTSPWTYVGGVASLIGLWMSAYGVYQLCRGVDYLVWKSGVDSEVDSP